MPLGYGLSISRLHRWINSLPTIHQKSHSCSSNFAATSHVEKCCASRDTNS